MTKRKKAGFTIVELVIVIAVIAILAAVLIPTFSNVIKKARKSAALQEATSAYKETRIIALDNGIIDNGETVSNNNGFTFIFSNDGLDAEVAPPPDFGYTVKVVGGRVILDEGSGDSVGKPDDNPADGSGNNSDNNSDNNSGNNDNTPDFESIAVEDLKICDSNKNPIGDEGINLIVGDSVELSATVQPEGADDRVIWTSSNTDIAKIDRLTGKVEAIAPGTATIMAISAAELTIYDSCLITVGYKSITDDDELLAAINGGGYFVLKNQIDLIHQGETARINVESSIETVLDLNGQTLTISLDFYEAVIKGKLTMKNGIVQINGAFNKSVCVYEEGALEFADAVVSGTTSLPTIQNAGTLTFINSAMVSDSKCIDAAASSRTIINDSIIKCSSDNVAITLSDGANLSFMGVNSKVESTKDDPIENTSGTIVGIATVNGELKIYQ